MATWFPASQLLLVVLLSWNVHCFPAKNGWGQHGPNEGSFTNMEAPPGPYYSSSQSAPAQPSSVSYPAVSFPYEPVKESVYSSPKTYPASSSPTPDKYSVASWNAAPGWDPVEESTTSQPIPDIGLPPPLPLFQAGELENYEGKFEHGNLDMETEELSFMPPPPPYPGPGFQAGELSRYASIYEHGNDERETEEQGFMPPPPYASAPQGAELSAAYTSKEGPMQPFSQGLRAVGPDRLFLTGQLPPGTVSHFHSDYETGRDHWGEVHYERYHFPIAQSPIIPTQTQEVPRDDGLWQQAQGYSKA